MAKEVTSMTIILRVENVHDANPTNWTITRVGTDHVCRESTAPGAIYRKTGNPEVEALSATQAGAAGAAGSLLKYIQDTKSAIEAADP